MKQSKGFKQKTYAEKIASVTARNRLKINSISKRDISIKSKKKKAKKPKSVEEKRSMKRWHELVWNECKRIVRARYMKHDGSWDCYTCNVKITDKADAHTAHGKPKSILGIKYKYDIRNLKVCCYNCNVNLGGSTDIFLAKLEKEEAGLEFLLETCYKDEFGAWRLKGDNASVQAKFYLPKLLDILKLTN